MEINSEILEIAEKITNIINSKNSNDELERYKTNFKLLEDKLYLIYLDTKSIYEKCKENGCLGEQKLEGYLSAIETVLGLFTMVSDSFDDGFPPFDED